MANNFGDCIWALGIACSMVGSLYEFLLSGPNWIKLTPKSTLAFLF